MHSFFFLFFVWGLFFCIVEAVSLGTLLADAPESVHSTLRHLFTGVNAFYARLSLSPPTLETDLDILVQQLLDLRLTMQRTVGGEPGVLTRLDNLIIPLWRIQRLMDYSGPLDIPEVLQITSFDVYVTDITPKTLFEDVSLTMGTPYLASTHLTSQWPLQGKIYGSRMRVMFTVPVHTTEPKSPRIMVHFLFDTGAPATLIAKDTLDALNLAEHNLGTVNVRINGVIVRNLLVSDSQPCHFKGVNILGMDYLYHVHGRLEVDLKEQTVSLTKQQI